MTDTATTTVWTVKAMPVETRDKLTRGARMRNITIGEYLTRLVEMHENMRRESWDTKQFMALLKAHALEPVTE